MLDVAPLDNRAREEALLARAATLPPPGRRDGTPSSAYRGMRTQSVAIR